MSPLHFLARRCSGSWSRVQDVGLGSRFGGIGSRMQGVGFKVQSSKS